MKRQVDRDRAELPRPRVIANFAITWDGRISTRNQTPSDFSSLKDKQRLLEIRAEADAIVASAVTVSADTMTMTMGLPDAELRALRVGRGQEEVPLRVLVSGSGRINPELRIFKEKGAPVLIYTTDRMNAEVQEAFKGKATVKQLAGAEVNLREALESLHKEYGVRTVVFEGGGALLANLLREALVDELCLTLCPRIFGGIEGVTLTGKVGEWLSESVAVRLTEFQHIGDELFTRWSVKKMKISKKTFAQR